MIRSLVLLLTAAASLRAELIIPGCTAYGAPDFDAIQLNQERGVTGWRDADRKVLWFGELKQTGALEAAVKVLLPEKPQPPVRFTLTLAGKSVDAAASGSGEVLVKFGAFEIAKTGYQKFELSSPAPAGEITSLVLAGPAAEGAHFNTDPRRNAASVHLSYPQPGNQEINGFCCECTAVEDPVYTYYMATGFSRGYFGMQVNSPTERRIIFSVWDAAEGGDARDRTGVKEENHTRLLAKGEGVHASVFGNEGTGGHSHLKYLWKTGEPQKFVVTTKVDGTFTDYSGYWFHPEHKAWMLIASFRAPKDGKNLRGLYSFSENFGGSNGHLLRKARFGNQWLRQTDGQWQELTAASFSHDATGRGARLDRFMGVEDGAFFLSHGGFIEGFTPFGGKFTRPATGKPPLFVLPQ